MASDGAELADHVAKLKQELEDAEAALAAETPAPAAPAVQEAAPATTPAEALAEPAAEPEPEPSNLPGGVDSAPEAAEPEPAAATPAAPETPVLVALAESDGADFVTKIRKVATKLLDEGKILEGDLLTPGESGAVNSVLVKAVGELISKVGL